MTLQEAAPDPVAQPGNENDERPVARSERRRQATRRRRRSGIAYGVAVGALAVAIPVLGVVGVDAILSSSDGEVVDPVLDPSEPGYRALIQPSPTMLLVHENAEGAMVGGAVLSLAGGAGGGSVIVYPAGLVGEFADLGELSISVANDFNGDEAALAAAEMTLHVDVPEVVVMSDDDLADMYAVTGPLTIQNPDTLRLPDGTTFPAGALVLEPDEIPRYTGYLSPDESELNRLLRQQLVWNAWVDQLAAAEELSFPGEQDSGLARFLGGIVAGGHRIEGLPLESNPDAELAGSNAVLRLDEERWAEMLPELIPYPAGAVEGDRFAVRVLAGTEDTGAVRAAARRIVAAGGQVDMVGNADEFGHEETEIIYYDPAKRSAAQSVAEALGFGTVTRVDEIDDTADVIVVLGADANL